MVVLYIVLGLFVVGIITYMIISGGKIIDKQYNYIRESWSKLPIELNNFNVGSGTAINIDTDKFDKVDNQYFPKRVITIDTKSQKIAISELLLGKWDYKQNIYDSCNFKHDVFDFKQIIGGEIVISGRSSSSTGLSSGSATAIGGSSAIGGAISSSSTTNYINNMEYKLKLDSITNPVYNISFILGQTSETSVEYKKNNDKIIQLHAIIERIVENNKKENQ